VTHEPIVETVALAHLEGRAYGQHQTEVFQVRQAIRVPTGGQLQRPNLGKLHLWQSRAHVHSFRAKPMSAAEILEWVGYISGGLLVIVVAVALFVGQSQNGK
jgi:hypothetical protein